MSFSEEWNDIYLNNKHLSIWPWSDVVSLVMRYGAPTKSKYRVMELGCGAGANIPFFKSLKAEYFSIEGSKSIVSKLWKRFPEYKKNIIVGDFTKEISFSTQFDIVVDRGSLTHNTTRNIKHCLDIVRQKLKPGGKFIGVDWFSTNHTDYILKFGKQDDDIYTRTKFKKGQFAGVGRCHFSDEKHLKDLFKDFRFEMMEEKNIKTIIPKRGHVLAHWNFVVIKK